MQDLNMLERLKMPMGGGCLEEHENSAKHLWKKGQTQEAACLVSISVYRA